jgi:hypothetical protein
MLAWRTSVSQCAVFWHPIRKYIKKSYEKLHEKSSLRCPLTWRLASACRRLGLRFCPGSKSSPVNLHLIWVIMIQNVKDYRNYIRKKEPQPLEAVSTEAARMPLNSSALSSKGRILLPYLSPTKQITETVGVSRRSRSLNHHLFLYNETTIDELTNLYCSIFRRMSALKWK